ncbi:MAG: RelA/SpoT family protein [Tenericutes bacterium]|nr:RelA/SpoT family protein [Mycoplasmatota bacterium]
MYKIEDIILKCRQNEFTAEELSNISLAHKIVTEEFSSNSEVYSTESITHFTNVAGILADLNADSTTVIAGLLHGMTSEKQLEIVSKNFGEDYESIIKNLEKISHLKTSEFDKTTSNNLKKLLVGLAEDARVLIIKIADRLDVMRNAYILPPEEQKQKAIGTMEVYVPIIHRLGINSVKSELENLCLKYTKPDMYKEIEDKLNGTTEELNASLNEMKENISDILTEHGIKFEIKARVKSIYSIYHKLTTGHKWNEIYDILAMRLIVPTEEDCYLAIGLIHAKYRPVPKRFKDYIAMPKENMYQSLHTSVFGSNDNIYEIQVRTPEMDEIAEHGIASHWSYKEHGKNIQNLMEQKLEIFRNTIKMASYENDEGFQKNINDEIFNTQIYVFTPKGDVMELPSGSTPIDFAYRIHSGVGDKTVGAIVNDQIVPLNYKLEDGDIIKINTLNSAKPNKEWLNFVKTTQAKNKIKAYFSKKDRENYIELGKDLLEKEIRKQKLSISEVLKEENINKLTTDLKLKDYDELLLSIGSLRYTPAYIIDLIYEDKKQIEDIMLERVNRKVINKKTNYKDDIIVAGEGNILVSLAHCCNPVPGDEIIGFVTKGEGVSVHKKTCPNISDKTERLIDVAWNNKEESLFNANLTIKTNSMQNHILEIVTAASVKNVSINSIKEYENKEMLDYQVSIRVSNKDKLEQFIDEILKLNFVMEVTK